MVAQLAAECPLDLPHKVWRTLNPKGRHYGTCDLIDGKYFLIELDWSMERALAEQILIHEWAHALAWFDPPDGDHGEVWGKAYSRVYRAYLGVD